MQPLTSFSLRNRALTALLTIFFMLGGAYATGTLKQELIPSIQFPVIAVVTAVPGAGAAVVEEQVTKRIESAVLGLRGVDKLTSTSRDNVSTVMVQLNYGEDLGIAQTTAQRAVYNLRDLPDGANPTVVAGSLDDFPVIAMSVSGGANDQELLDRVRRVMVPRLMDIDGVREVQVSGATEQVVQVDADPAKLAAAGVSLTALTDVLKANGVVIPAGTLTAGASGQDLAVRVGAPIGSVEGLAALPLKASGPGGTAGQATTTVGAVATVRLVPGDVTVLSRTNGRPSLTLSLTKTPDGNVVTMSRELAAMRADLERAVTSGSSAIVYDQAPFIEESIRDLGVEGTLGLAFAVLVVALFLMSLRLTLVTAVSIPLSLLIALLGLRVGGFTLNILTLGALTIAVGRVVDDSIVVVENIQRHLGLGEDKRAAIPAAVREVGMAITSSTLATVAVFLPLGLVGGMVGELFRPFAFTVTLAMLASLFVALTIVPVLAYWFVRMPAASPPSPGPAADQPAARHAGPTRLQRGYLPVLRWTLARPLITAAIGLAIFVASGVGAMALKTDFIGDSGGHTLIAQLKLPAGTSLPTTDARAKVVEDYLATRQDIATYQVTVGASGAAAAFLGGGADTAVFYLTLADTANAATTTTQLREFADSHRDLGNLTVTPGNASPASTQVQVIVEAPDLTSLRTAADQVTAAVRGIPGARDATNNLAALVPSVSVTIDRSAASRFGLSESAVGGIVASALRGIALGDVSLDGVGHRVVLRTMAAPTDLAQLRALPVIAIPGAAPVPLSALARIEQVEEPASISRVDGARSATVSATPTSDDLGAVTSQLRSALDGLQLPAGATARIGGVSADQAKAFGQMGIALAIAIAITYAILVATFKSLLQPVLLMVSIPFAATGAIVMLLATRTALGVPAMVGLLMLVGIVVTNAIVLIDLINQYRAQGKGISEAVFEGATHRLRPIVMTALATVLALSPMALALTGGGAFISRPLALVVIGGLLSSTALTLILVPVLYVLVERFRQRRGFGADHREPVTG